MIQVREAVAKDINEINSVSAHLGYSPSSINTAENRLNDILNSESDFLWVCTEGNTIRGWLHLFVALRLASPKFLEIGGLVVEESSRRQGIGRELVNEAIRYSKRSKLSLRVRCNSNRKSANQFYKDLGFVTNKKQNVHEIHYS